MHSTQHDECRSQFKFRDDCHVLREKLVRAKVCYEMYLRLDQARLVVFL
jgi:hypothetical protein